MWLMETQRKMLFHHDFDQELAKLVSWSRQELQNDLLKPPSKLMETMKKSRHATWNIDTRNCYLKFLKSVERAARMIFFENSIIVCGFI